MIKNEISGGTIPVSASGNGPLSSLRASLAGMTRLHWTCVLLLFVCYTLLRVVVWQRTVLFEDNDSVALVWWTQVFLAFDPEAIVRMDADANLFYTFLGALCSLPGLSAEAGARLASLLSSLALFWIMFLIGLRIARPFPVLLGLVLLTFNPEMVRLSPAVLTEPSYVAVIHAGLLVLWWQLPRLSYAGAAGAAILFGCAFLIRMEGILFLAFGPLVAGLYYFLERPVGWGGRRLLSWSLLYVACFCVISGLQIWRVSHVTGTPAINGRQVWIALRAAPVGGDSPDSKLWGLDFRPDQVNIRYLKQNARELSDLPKADEPSAGLVRNFAVTLIDNLRDLHNRRMVELFGLPVVVLAVLGLLLLYESGRRFELVLVLLVVAWGLAAPLLHNVVIRHIAVIAPLLLLIAGIGADSLARMLSRGPARMTPWMIPLGAVALALAAWAHPLRAALTPAQQNRYENPAALEDPVRIVRRIAEEKPRRTVMPIRRGRADPPGPPIRKDGRQAAVASMSPFLSYYTEARFFILPWTDYRGLVNYCRLNHVDVLYLLDIGVAYPFLTDFESDAWQADFSLLHSFEDASGRRMRLYRVKPAPSDEESQAPDTEPLPPAS
jgi:hypothetical protein